MLLAIIHEYEDNFSHMFPSFFPQGAPEAYLNLFKHNAQRFFLRNLDFRVFRHRALTNITQTKFSSEMNSFKTMNEEQFVEAIRKILQYITHNFSNHRWKRYVDCRAVSMASFKLKKVIDLDIKKMFEKGSIINGGINNFEINELWKL